MHWYQTLPLSASTNEVEGSLGSRANEKPVDYITILRKEINHQLTLSSERH